MLVRSGLTRDRVALWERHSEHPDGEVFIAGDAVVEVAATDAVLKALREGRLVEVRADVPRKLDLDVQYLTVGDILTMVEQGKLTVQEALAAERKGRNRVTLVRQLEERLTS